MAAAPLRAATATALIELSDGELVAAHIHGVDGAFAELYARCHPRLVRTLQARVMDATLAEEFAQEAITRVFANITSFDSQRPFWPWLKTIALNVATDAARKGARVTAVPQLDDVPQHMDAFALLEGNDLAGQCLRALPPRQRWALVALHVQGLPRSDLAEHLEITLNALDQLLFRARARLRDEYIKRDPELAYRWRLSVLLWLPQALRRLKGRLMMWGTQSPAAAFAASEVAAPAVAALAALVVLAAPISASAGHPVDAGNNHASAAAVAVSNDVSKPLAARSDFTSRRSMQLRVSRAGGHLGREARGDIGAASYASSGEAPPDDAAPADGANTSGAQRGETPAPTAPMPKARAEVGRRGSTYEAKTSAEADAAGEPVEAQGRRYIPCGGPVQRAVCDGAEEVEKTVDRLPDPADLPPQEGPPRLQPTP